MTGWRLWLARGLKVAVLVVGLFVMEVFLRWSGCGYSPSFCVPLNGTNLVENSKFLWQYYSRKTSLRPTPFIVGEKPANGLRVVVLGESAAAGTPDPAYSIGRILERMLAKEYPQRHVEVITAAMPGVNSHVILPVARDCLRLKPDLFVLYAGNNEVDGLYAPGGEGGWLASHRQLVQAHQKIHATRLAQCLNRVWNMSPGAGTPVSKDAEYFKERRVGGDNPKRQIVYRNFCSNLVDICSVAQQAGVRVVLSTVAVNLRDCPPLASMHRRGMSASELERWQAEYAAGRRAEEDKNADVAEALRHFTAAAALDDRYAELLFRMARCYRVLGQTNKVYEAYGRARDWDALPMRADSRINESIRQVAAQLPGETGRLVDVERRFFEAEGPPGETLFYDHVHPNFDGSYLVAETLLPAVRELLGASQVVAVQTNGLPLSRDDSATQLAFTRVNEWQAATAMLKAQAGPPFTEQLGHGDRMKAAEGRLTRQFGEPIPNEIPAATAVYHAAIREFPDDWFLTFNLGQLLLVSRNKYAEATEQFQATLRRVPHWMPVRVGLSVALSGAGKYTEALQTLREALVFDPSSEAAKAGIAALESRWRGGAIPNVPAEAGE